MAVAEDAVRRPNNIVFLLADDLGYTDIAPYGSEVSTPTLAPFAEKGIRFTNFHTAANCAPSRAMLLTGVSNHLAGVPNIPEMLATSRAAGVRQLPGRTGRQRGDNRNPAEDCYHTYMAGKWHLGSELTKLLLTWL
ncbi:MAG: sulfatase-like hydrolase/transferase [Candidatus Azotimanducaceae bacterium WSBS_2022_MAG_OTU7]